MSLKSRKPQASGDPALAAALAALPPAALGSVWLGALLCERLAEASQGLRARAILDALEAMRAATLDLSPVPAGARGTPAREGKAVARLVDPEALRAALLQERRLAIVYRDGKSRTTSRVVWPLAVEDYGPNGAMLAWCETRRDFRNFRFDRIGEIEVLPERAAAPRDVMLAFHATLAGLEDGEQW
jgi:predicted DNA-binding transcriptional regulator YafY